VSLLIGIGDDPNIWKLSQDIDASTLTASPQLFSAEVVSPLAGTLLVSLTAAASIALYDVPPMPPVTHPVFPNGGGIMDPPSLYLPSVTALNAGTSSEYLLQYRLPYGTDLPSLESEIAAAMSDGTCCTVPFSGTTTSGVLVLNGATLPFVVLCPG
jgi:hypothetical protein